MFEGTQDRTTFVRFFHAEHSAANTVCVVIQDFVAAAFHGPEEVIRWLKSPLIEARGDVRTSTEQADDVPPLFREEGDSCIVVPLGLFHYFIDRLRKRRVEVVVANSQPCDWDLMPDGRSVTATAEDDLAGLRVYGTFYRTQVEVADDDDLVKRLAAIAAVHCYQRVLIPTVDIARARYLFERLKSRLGPTVQLASGRWRMRGHYIICPVAELRDPSAWQLVLLPDPVKLIASAASDKLAMILTEGCAKSVYAFPVAGQQITKYEDLLIQSLAGPVVHRISKVPADEEQGTNEVEKECVAG